MRPPAHVTAAAVRLGQREFTNRFGELVAQVRTPFYKLEVWQTYREPGTASLRAFEDGRDQAEVRDLIRAEAEAEHEGYATFRRRGVRFIRLRLVDRPLSAYLRWELLNYEVRAERRYGEHVRLIDVTDEVDRLPNELYFDFVVFGGRTALVHDYGDHGLQNGGWAVTDPVVVSDLVRTARDLESRSVPLAQFRVGARPELPVGPR